MLRQRGRRATDAGEQRCEPAATVHGTGAWVRAQYLAS